MNSQESDPFAPGLLQRLPATPRKVAILRASRIGDLVCATPALRALRAALPGAEIVLITLPMLRELAERFAAIDRVVEFPGYPGLAEQLYEPSQFSRFIQKIQAEAFDLAIQMQGTGLYSNPFIQLLGASATAGMLRPGDPALQLDAAFRTVEQGSEVQRLLDYVAFLGAPSLGKTLEVALRESDRLAAENLIQGLPLPLIGLHPAARDRTRRWSSGHFIAAAQVIQERCGGTLVGIGEIDERDEVEAVLSGIHGQSVNLAGQTSLPELCSLISKIGVLITNDSGPAHLAYAMGTPAVVIFGSADPARYLPPVGGPYKALIHPVECRPCGLSTCPIGYACLEGVTVESVVEAAVSLLA